jgi:predicted secreted Zn-dependent protease
MTRDSFPIFALALLLFSSPALAKDSSRTITYPVIGATAAEVYDFIKRRAPRVARNATFAFTMIATKTNSRTAEAKQGCRYTRFNTSAWYAFTLPRHAKPGALAAGTRAKWNGFTAYLKNHEAGHRDIWRMCFSDYDKQALALTSKDCAALDKAREKLFTRIKKACVQKDEAHDVTFRKAVLAQPFVQEALKR